jgi:alanine-glyoxylate transaminase/serine-glyoxylate transaminase/serine-pyruvate transaminase
MEKIKARSTKVQSWFLDLNLVMAYWGGGAKRTYHHTAPVNGLYALHEALVMLQQEGLETAWERHRRHFEALRAGLQAMGLRYLVDEADRLPQLNAVRVPQGIDEAAVRQALLQDYGLEIGAGLGPLTGKIWRIGLMGHTATLDNVLLCLRTLGDVLARMGHACEPDKAVSAARAA